MSETNTEWTALHKSLHALFSILIAKRWWVVAGTVLITAGCWLYALLSTPVYRAATVVAPAEQGATTGALSSMLQQFGGLSSLAGINLGSGGGELEEAIGVLESREFTQNFIERNSLRPVLFKKLWDETRGEWRVPPEKRPTPARAFKYFHRVVRTVVRDRRTGLITIQIEWTDRQEAARWANELVKQLNAEMRSRAIADANAYVEYLEKEFAQTSMVATREAISRLMEANVKRRMVATVTPEFAFRVVDTALPPDKNDPTRPRKFLLLVAGPFVGLFISVILVLSYVLVFGMRKAATQ